MFKKIADKMWADLLELEEVSKKRFLSWKGAGLEDALRESFLETKKIVNNLSSEELKKHLEVILETRIFFKMLKDSYRRKEFRGACLRGVGQEAVGAGMGLATKPHDVVTRDHRSFSLPIARGTPVDVFWLNHLMRKDGPSGGHDANTHFADLERNDLGFLVSDMAIPIVIINGAVYYLNMKREFEKGSELLPNERSCGVGMMGDGASSNGMTHAGMNFAKANNLPILFGILNNQISFMTPPKEQHGGIDLSNRGLAYEMPSFTVDGDNVYEVYFAAKFLLDFCRKTNHPALLHAITLRRCGHNDSEQRKYMKEIYGERWSEDWEEKDKNEPLRKAREVCEEFRILDKGEYEKMEKKVCERVEIAYKKALASPEPSADDLRSALIDPECKVVSELANANLPKGGMRKLTFMRAEREALKIAMEKDPLLIMLGEDIGFPGGGAFKVTMGPAKEFGKKRVMNSTLDEGAIAGFTVGACLMGAKVIAEYQFWNFFLSSPAPLLTLAATRPFMQGCGIAGVWMGPAGCGAGSNNYHEARPESYLAKALGIKIVAPSTAEDAKGLLLSAIADPDPVAFITDILSYVESGDVIEGEYYTPFRAVVRKEGKDITIITWGFSMLKIALESAETLAKDDIDVEIVDLLILNPWDKETVLSSVRKTGRVIILHEDSKFMGFGAEISAAVTEDDAFYNLRARVKRVAAKNIPIPGSLVLEKSRLPNIEQVVSAAKELMEES